MKCRLGCGQKSKNWVSTVWFLVCFDALLEISELCSCSFHEKRSWTEIKYAKVPHFCKASAFSNKTISVQDRAKASFNEASLKPFPSRRCLRVWNSNYLTVPQISILRIGSFSFRDPDRILILLFVIKQLNLSNLTFGVEESKMFLRYPIKYAAGPLSGKHSLWTFFSLITRTL